MAGNPDISYDLSKARSKLSELIDDLTPANLKKAVKNALRQEARQVLKAAQQNLVAAWPSTRGNAVKAGMRQEVYKSGLGFAVKISTKRGNKLGGADGMHVNRYGLIKPVMMFAELGASNRATKGGRRPPHSTGSLEALGFMKKTSAEELPDAGTRLCDKLEKQAIKIAKKYGGK